MQAWGELFNTTINLAACAAVATSVRRCMRVCACAVSMSCGCVWAGEMEVWEVECLIGKRMGRQCFVCAALRISQPNHSTNTHTS